MRLREIKDNLEKIGTSFKVEHVSNSNGTVQLQNLGALNIRLSKLEEFEAFEQSINKLNKVASNIYNFRGQHLNVNGTDFNNYKNTVDEINIELKAILAVIDMVIPKQEPYSVSIKLPPYKDLKKVARFINDIEKIFGQILPKDLSTEIKLNNFDTGSNWIEIIINNKEAMLLLGSFVDITLIYAKQELINILNFKSLLEKSQNVVDEKESEVNIVIKELIRENTSIRVEEFIQNNDISEERVDKLIEYKETVLKHMVELGKYISEGAEVHPALNAPEEIKNEFPSSEATKSISHELKTLLIETVGSLSEENE